MKNILKKIVIAVVLIPFVLIILFVAFEIMGAIVNSATTAKQTKQLKSNIEDMLQNSVVLDTYSETGNTSGTGNHVDMLSVVVFQTDDNIEQILEKMQSTYEFDEWCCWVEELNVIVTAYQEHDYYYFFCENMELPENTDNCYVFYLNRSAPFVDNIVGH